MSISCENCGGACRRKHWTLTYGFRKGHEPPPTKDRAAPGKVPVCDACVQRIPPRERRAEIGTLGKTSGRYFFLSPTKSVKDDDVIWSTVDTEPDKSRAVAYLSVDMAQRRLRKAADKLITDDERKWAPTAHQKKRRRKGLI